MGERPQLNKLALFRDLGYEPHPGQLEVHRSAHPRRIIASGVRWGKCARATGEVYDLGTGRRRSIAEPGALVVQAWNSDLFAYERAAIAAPAGRKPCVRVVLASGQHVELSTDHPVLTARGWIEAADLQLRDVVASPQWLPEPATPLRETDDRLVVLACLLMYGCTADTGADYSKLPGPLLDHFRAAVRRLGGDVEQRSARTSDWSVGGIEHLVTEWGLGGCTSKTKRLPAAYYGLATDQIGRFLSLLWSDDGWVSDRVAGITMPNRLLVEDIRHLLLRIEVRARIRRDDKKCNGTTFEAWTLTVNGSSNVARFLKHIRASITREDLDYDGRFTHQACRGVLWSRVRSVEPIGEHDVYDLSVDVDHNFACNNVIVHNTTCSAMEGLAAALEPADYSVGWVVAPTYDLADRVFRELQLIIAQHLRHRLVTMKDNERRIVLRNMGGGLSEIRGKTADNPVSLLGEGLDWLIVDEAARLKPMIWQSHLSQRLIDKRGWALLISTPKGRGYFYDLFLRGQGRDADYKSWNYPSWTNPMLDAALIEEERTRLPERVFQQEFGAQFIEGSGAVFRNIRECATGTWQPPSEEEVYYGGLDLAKVEDFTVLVIMNTKREVVFADRFNRIDWSLQVQRITAAADRYRRAWVLCDTTGAGEPVYETLRRSGCWVKPYPFTMKSKAALIDNLALMLEQREIVLPRPELWPAGIDELEAFEFSVTDAGNVRSGAPSGMHDDCVMALALAAWQVSPARPRPKVTIIETYIGR